MMFAIAVTKSLQIGITAMKHSEAPLMKATLLEQSRTLGARLARLRVARRLRQSDVAVRAGVSRSTAVLIEKGDPGRTLGQVLRYLDAIAPGATLLSLLQESDPALLSLAAGERSQRVRKLSPDALEDLDF